jgi:hypothetical protein
MCDSTNDDKGGKFLSEEMWQALKGAGFTDAELYEDQPFGPIIHAYTRRQAIEDGTLVDLMHGEPQELVRQAGIKLPVVITAAAFSQAIAPIDGELPPGQDLNGRLWDVLMMLRHAIRTSGGDTDRVQFEIRVWNGTKHETVQLWALVGPGDEGEPVLTIMLQGED